MSYSPTPEQSTALDAFRSGRPLKISAFAGAGKTTTLTMLAQSRRDRGLYLAFNKSIATEAKEKFPKTVDCRTTHSIAWQAIKSSYRFSTGKMKDPLHPKQLAEMLELPDRLFASKVQLKGVHQAHLLLRTIRRFCQSDATAIQRDHVPQYGRLLGLKEDIVAEIQTWALSQANALWTRMTNHRDRIPLGHDGYLKLWALGTPMLGADYIMLDEAQDTNPVVLGVLRGQSSQIVYVGDRHQQIYEWRGAVNAMEKIANCTEVHLTQSFRFGQMIADAASLVLRTLGETHRIQGTPQIASKIGGDLRTRAILARTNVTVFSEILDVLSAGLKPHVIGGTDELKRLLSDVFELKDGRPGSCPEFFGFQKWTEVVEFSETEEGEDIRPFVQLVEQHGERRLWAAISNVNQAENRADVVISTAHKAKGREWDSVRLAPDFLSSRIKATDPDAEAEVRLFYVAMTRAQRYLSVDRTMLSTFISGSWKSQTEDNTRSHGGFRSSTSKIMRPSTTDVDRLRKIAKQIENFLRLRA